ncbi:MULTISPECIES: YcfL family protein [Pasteurellaceae]|uniref:DUF1425 domain-containing protein n=1 Tax=Rodentibacter genomosp. 1 TaxID=1908264 RepID=A0A1V3J2H6_9PAST|nr:DUF1425 domain-containing protein [Rodentibacter genomosp. 1]MBF0750663.1 DUF1425 domain-containing protein [Pasteurella sp. 19428wF3_WM03]OOF49120.1 hypothetical protein BKK54_09340 [Rodentibacter genomosp. 1]TFU52933.1 DUF1425 domain-containing protein [Pasteurella sp. WM03]
MKRLLIALMLCMLAACSSPVPNLVHTNRPILNITADLSPLVEVKTDFNSAWVKNKSIQPINVNYHLFWYNEQGVTQVWEQQRESMMGNLYLQAQEQKSIELAKPTPESTNYRLYLQ